MLQENEMVEIAYYASSHSPCEILSLALRSHLFEEETWHDPQIRWMYMYNE